MEKEGLCVDTSISVIAMTLKRLNNIKVRTFKFREFVWAHNLKCGNSSVQTPAKDAKGS